MFKSVALIPARQGSKRIKNKNIINLNGHPLMAYTIKSAIKSRLFDKVICVTDSLKYKKIAEKYGASVPFLRPRNISGKNSADINWVLWIMKKINLKNNYKIFSILRPTNPLRTEKVIREAFKIFLKKDADSLRAVQPCLQHPYKMWKKKKNFIVPLLDSKSIIPFHSRQYSDLPKIYCQNASIEIAWTKVLTRKFPSISGEKIIPFYSKNYEGFDINTPDDLYLLKTLLKNKIVKLKKI